MSHPGSPVLSVVLAARNNWHYVRGCLHSLPEGGVPDYEVIVVDNASTDGTAQRVREKFPLARIIQNETNTGHCHAMNQGIAASRGKYVLVLDGDTVLVPGAARRMVEFLEARPDVAIVAPRMLNEDGSVQETARSFPTVMNGLWGRQSLLTAWFPNHPMSKKYLRRDALTATEPFEVDWVSAAAMLFRRTLPEQIGYWDETIRGYWVDADWCKTAHQAGKIFCDPGSKVIHYEQNRKGIKKTTPRILLFHEGAYRFYSKHYTAGAMDPRAWFAGAALGARALLLIVADLFLKEAPDQKRPAAEEDTPKPLHARVQTEGADTIDRVE
ncbi:MAG: glycosyltransferase family 2 protein [Bryobacterales bacterium]|nr:glycosyltransferase family 2 protein [Bryobacterales bacterium]